LKEPENNTTHACEAYQCIRGWGIPEKVEIVPNGTPDFGEKDLPLLEAFFARLSGALTRFAEAHTLTTEKYWHQCPSWRFTFRHPKGGLACLEVMKEGDEEVVIYSYWWIDDVEKARRNSCRAQSERLTLDEIQIHRRIEETLSMVLSWSLDDLTTKATGFEQACKGRSKEDLQRELSQYPYPT
jgi:hypothetical protein